MAPEKHFLAAQRVTPGDGQYFQGYYDKCPWNASESRIFAQKAPFREQNPTGDEPLELGLIEDGAFRRFAVTHAWNWQQGCMLRWLPLDAERVVSFNDQRGDHYVNRQLNLDTGEERIIPWPIYDLSHGGFHGSAMNFERITETRPGYGYFALPDPFSGERAPKDDGLYVVDLDKAERRLILSLADALDLGTERPPEDHKCWFNCMVFNPGGTRIVFLHRWGPHAISGHVGFFTRMITIGIDGSDPRVILEGLKISHFDWQGDSRILVWLESPPQGIHGYYLVDALTGGLEPVGKGLFATDGHCNLSPDGRWMVTDTYPKGPDNEQALILYELATGRRVDVGAFAALPVPNDSMRCDLHTRWDRTGKRLCFDSTHEGSRQVYTMDVSPIVGG